MNIQPKQLWQRFRTGVEGCTLLHLCIFTTLSFISAYPFFADARRAEYFLPLERLLHSSAPEGNVQTLGGSHKALLQSVRITPRDELALTVFPGQTIPLAANGIFSDGKRPVNVKWTLTDATDAMGTLSADCVSTCVFRAGWEQGSARIRIDVSGTHNSDWVRVRVLEKPKSPFEDSIPDWALISAPELQRMQIMSGYDDGRFGAEDALTKGQFVTILYRSLRHLQLMEEPMGCEQVFSDVRENHPAYKPLCLFVENGWETPLNRYGADDYISREEVASLLMRVVGSPVLKAKKTTVGALARAHGPFSDVSTSSSNFLDTAFTYEAGLMTGYKDGRFGMGDSLNRAEASVLAYRLVKLLETLGIQNL